MRLISEHPPNWGDGSEIGNAAANFAKLPGGERRRRELTTLPHGRQCSVENSMGALLDDFDSILLV